MMRSAIEFTHTLKVNFCITGTSIVALDLQFSADIISRYVSRVSVHTSWYLPDHKYLLHETINPCDVQFVVESRTHYATMPSPCITVRCNKIHTPHTAWKENETKNDSAQNVMTNSNAPLALWGFIKLLLWPPPATCRATSRFDVYMPGIPEMKGTIDTFSLWYCL